MKTYIDTSALAKWYLNEVGSGQFAEWMVSQEDTHISTLTMTEFRCLLARRERNRELGSLSARQIYTIFEQDIELGFLIVQEVKNADLQEALVQIERLANLPLRTLDAMHIAIAERQQMDAIASADKVMLAAAEQLGMTAISFVPD
ncbi:MAG: type II toxin-antitoxin system VapC family toxin [Thiolinea sp.]